MSAEMRTVTTIDDYTLIESSTILMRAGSVAVLRYTDLILRVKINIVDQIKNKSDSVQFDLKNTKDLQIDLNVVQGSSNGLTDISDVSFDEVRHTTMGMIFLASSTGIDQQVSFSYNFYEKPTPQTGKMVKITPEKDKVND